MILLIDNYDSFVYNLKRYFVQLGQPVVVLRNDDPRLAQVLAAILGPTVGQGEPPAERADPWLQVGFERMPAALVISPGPKSPQSAGYCLELVRAFSDRLPMLGVCLGHQILFEAFGGQIIRAHRPVHGQTSLVELADSRLFAGLGSSVEFARYHSLICDSSTCPPCLRIVAWHSESDQIRQIMAIEHQQRPIFGVQFHPESILSAEGLRLLSNFLEIVGISRDQSLPDADLLEPHRPATKPGSSQLDADSADHAVVLPEPSR